MGFKSNNSAEKCSVCPLSKGTLSSHPTSSRKKAKQVGQIVLTDLIGPLTPTSIGKSKYILLFTDEFSQYRSSYFLKTEDEVIHNLEEYIAKIETETGYKLKSLHSDFDSKFVDLKVKTLLNLEHVVHVNSAFYTPQQNGAAERSNRTLIEATRTILNASNLPKEL